MCQSELSHPNHDDPSQIPAHILAANKRWACRMNQTCPEYFPDPEAKQRPKILWLGCSDSRVLESDATVAKPGDVFVHRNIANQFQLNDDNALSVVAYALRALSVQHIIVVGHTNCGGVLTAMERARSPRGALGNHLKIVDSLYYETNDPIGNSDEANGEGAVDPDSALQRWLTPLVDRLRGLPPPLELEHATEENVKLQVENLASLRGFVQTSAAKKPVWIHGWVYDFATGFIKNLHITRQLGAE
ncbi:carbonic anhydrase [Phlebopus sp. FC_14]|nr:carbonic anhydrase [Phlebopus sp. FC_14]